MVETMGLEPATPGLQRTISSRSYLGSEYVAFTCLTMAADAARAMGS